MVAAGIRGGGHGKYLEHGPHSMAMHVSSLCRCVRYRFYTWVLPAHAPTYIRLFTQTRRASKMLRYGLMPLHRHRSAAIHTCERLATLSSPVTPALCWVLGHRWAPWAPRSFRPWTKVELKQGPCASTAYCFVGITEL